VIYEKFKQLSGRSIQFPHLVSTIDSFINQYITLPFYYLKVKGAGRPRILEDNKFIDDVWKPKFHYKDVRGNPFCFAYPPHTIRYEKDGSFSSNGTRPDDKKVKAIVFDRYCLAIKNWQIEKGLITTGDSAYIALELLSMYPRIVTWLARRFPHIIVDEAQDNSEVQHALFDKMIQHGLENIEFVGDPYQSIYEWRDANPRLFLAKYNDRVNWNGLVLTDNRRSNQRIVDCFSMMRVPTDRHITSVSEGDRRIPIIVYKYDEANSPSIVTHFENLCRSQGLEHNHIVVRGNALRNKMLGKEADQKPWKSPLPEMVIEAKNLFEGKDIKSAIELMREIAIVLLLPGSDYHEKKAMVKDDYQFNAHLLCTLKLIPCLSATIANWTIHTEKFLEGQFKLEKKVDFELKTKSSKYFSKTVLDEPVEKHFKKLYTESSIPVTTVHKVKGMTLDGILIFFNEQRHKENITFEDIQPSKDFPTERQRLIYVAMSRPKHLLAMAFPQSVENGRIVGKFGNKAHIVEQIDLDVSCGHPVLTNEGAPTIGQSQAQ
jgi:superfamily I DNA/RNA helicase